MKQTIESPWSVGDIGWAIYKRTETSNAICDACGNFSKKKEYKEEVRECKIDAIDIRLTTGIPVFWYVVGFDIGDNYNGDRFTFGTSGISNVYSTKEEAEESLKNE